jgi:hypothetical protein
LAVIGQLIGHPEYFHKARIGDKLLHSIGHYASIYDSPIIIGRVIVQRARFLGIKGVIKKVMAARAEETVLKLSDAQADLLAINKS